MARHGHHDIGIIRLDGQGVLVHGQGFIRMIHGSVKTGGNHIGFDCTRIIFDSFKVSPFSLIRPVGLEKKVTQDDVQIPISRI